MIPCQAVTSVLCLLFRPQTVHCSTKNAYTSEITFLALVPWCKRWRFNFPSLNSLLIHGFILLIVITPLPPYPLFLNPCMYECNQTLRRNMINFLLNIFSSDLRKCFGKQFISILAQDKNSFPRILYLELFFINHTTGFNFKEHVSLLLKSYPIPLPSDDLVTLELQ